MHVVLDLVSEAMVVAAHTAACSSSGTKFHLPRDCDLKLSGVVAAVEVVGPAAGPSPRASPSASPGAAAGALGGHSRLACIGIHGSRGRSGG